MKQIHVEFQDYSLESSKTENLLLASQSADQNLTNKQVEVQESSALESKEFYNFEGVSAQVNLFFLFKVIPVDSGPANVA